MPYPNWIGSHNRFWTREKVLEGLAAAGQSISGPLPCCDRTYNEIKTGRLDWPTTHRILEYFGSMARAWLAAGFPKDRISLRNIAWIPEEIVYLKEYAGDKTLKQIAAYLRRSRDAVKHRLYELDIKARDNQGYLSAAQVAQHFNCPYHRVRDGLLAGELPGSLDKVRNRWRVDLIKLSAENKAMLMAPKRTYTTFPPDLGNYYQRHRIKRTIINGKLERVPAVT